MERIYRRVTARGLVASSIPRRGEIVAPPPSLPPPPPRGGDALGVFIRTNRPRCDVCHSSLREAMPPKRGGSCNL